MNDSLVQKSWSVWTGTDNEWHRLASGLNNFNLYQSAEWSVHKRNSGWLNCRIVALDSQAKIHCAAQCLFRKGPLNSVVVWIPGGPIGNLKYVNDGFVSALKSHLQTKLIYIRSSIMSTSSDETTT